MILSDKRLRRWFLKYNDLYFENRLPSCTKITWRPVEGCWAQAFGGEAPEIHIHPMCGVSNGWTKLTLLHEMAHLDLYPSINHGASFENRMKELAQAGAFKGLW